MHAAGNGMVQGESACAGFRPIQVSQFHFGGTLPLLWDHGKLPADQGLLPAHSTRMASVSLSKKPESIDQMGEVPGDSETISGEETLSAEVDL